MNVCAVVLAAGQGTRMNSSKPKVLIEILNRPMLSYVIDSVKALNPLKIVMVVGETVEEIKNTIQDHAILYVTQEKPLGTGNALDSARDTLSDLSDTTIVVLNGDCPLITPDALQNLLSNHKKDRNDLSFLSFIDESLSGYGRVLRDGSGGVAGIVEDKHADSQEKTSKELNGGVYAMGPDILDYLEQLKIHRSSGEYYLTDIIAISVRNGRRVNSYTCGSEVLRGVNTKEELLQVSKILDRRAAVIKHD
jgi:bifunctional UDP-N-acetylglucosamine pyrophosphorylase/glucosamine-1-phosphate N-acetyltransferase